MLNLKMRLKMKKLIKNLAVIAIALFGFAIIGTNVSSGIENPYPAPPPGGGGGGEDCNLCVVTNWYGKVIFSCRPKLNSSCSDSGGGYTVSCEGAKEC